MRVIKKEKLNAFFAEHQQGKKPLLKWYGIVKKTRWRSFAEMRRTFSSADEITVNSGRKAVVFDIKGNYRLITAVHYERTVERSDDRNKRIDGKVFLFYFLTHTEYDKNLWKGKL